MNKNTNEKEKETRIETFGIVLKKDADLNKIKEYFKEKVNAVEYVLDSETDSHSTNKKFLNGEKYLVKYEYNPDVLIGLEYIKKEKLTESLS